MPTWTLLTVAMSMQMVRAQLSYFRYLFGDRFGRSFIQLGVLAITDHLRIAATITLP